MGDWWKLARLRWNIYRQAGTYEKAVQMHSENNSCWGQELIDNITRRFNNQPIIPFFVAPAMTGRVDSHPLFYWEKAVRAMQRIFESKNDPLRTPLCDRIIESGKAVLEKNGVERKNGLGMLHGFFGVLVGKDIEKIAGALDERSNGMAMAVMGMFYSALAVSRIEEGSIEEGIGCLIVSTDYLSQAAHHGEKSSGELMGEVLQRLAEVGTMQGNPSTIEDEHPALKFLREISILEKREHRPWAVSAYFIGPDKKVFSYSRRAEPAVTISERLIGRSGTHAEVNGILQAEASRGIDWSKVRAVVTLEPCLHCAQALAIRGIAGVTFGVVDPNPDINGDGLKHLRWAGIPVDLPGQAFQMATTNLIAGGAKLYTQAELESITKDVVVAGTRPLAQLVEEIQSHFQGQPEIYSYYDQWELFRLVSEIVWNLDGAQGKFTAPQIIVINADKYTPQKAATRTRTRPCFSSGKSKSRPDKQFVL